MPRTSVKSPDAFRTISEAADALDLPQHVLRFWETRFSQIKPMKRSGGRRYYRPTDIALLQGIRHLLYDEGYTIKGVQRILREQGVAHVAGLGSNSGLAAPPADEPAPLPTPQAAAPKAPSMPAPEVQPSAVPTPVIQPQLDSREPVQDALIQTAPVPPEPQVPPSPVQQTVPADAVNMPVPPSALPAISHPPTVQASPSPAAVQFQPQPNEVPSAPETVTPPTKVPAASLSSSLRFIPEAEGPPEPSQAPVSVPVPSTVPTPETAVPSIPASPSATAGQRQLSAQNTEALVQALRTLLDCKAILDSARQPTPKPGPANQ